MYQSLSSKHLFFFTLLFLKTLIVSAQGLCGNVKGAEKGGFTLDKYYSCTVPATINITNTSGVSNVQYVFVYDGQDEDSLQYLQPISTPNYTYLTDGVFTILQYGTKNGKPMYACQEVTITSNPKPDFTYNACNGNVLELNIPKNTTNIHDSYEVTIAGVAPFTVTKPQLPYTFKKTNLPFSLNRAISIKGIPPAGSGCPPTTTTIVADMSGGATKAEIKSVVVAPDGKSATIELKGAKGVDYQFYFRESTQNFPPLGSALTKQSGLTTVELDDISKSYCFRYFRTFAGTCWDLSNEICTLPPQTTIDGKQNTITQASFPAVLKHDLFNNPSQIITNTLVNQSMKAWRIEPNGTLTPMTVFGNTTFSDSPTDCRKITCYQIQTEIKQKGANTDNFTTLIKQKYCVDRSKIKAPAIKIGAVSVDAGNKIDIVYDDVTNWKLKRDTFFVFRADDKIKFKQIGFQTAPAPYKDIAIDASKQQYCYKVGYVDECGSRSKDSLIFCSIFLQAQNQNLIWTPETPYQKLVSTYTVEKFDEITNAISTDATIAAPKVTHLPDLSLNEYKGIFRIKTPTNNGNFSYSNIVTIPIIPAVYLPTAFTPNGDNSPTVNEKFTLTGHTRRFDEFIMQIFNRWGNVVYETKDPKEGWNGKLNNNDAPVGPYGYAIDVKLDTGEKLRWSGIVMLLR